jgi:hypothetical protein
VSFVAVVWKPLPLHIQSVDAVGSPSVCPDRSLKMLNRRLVVRGTVEERLYQRRWHEVLVRVVYTRGSLAFLLCHLSLLLNSDFVS